MNVKDLSCLVLGLLTEWPEEEGNLFGGNLLKEVVGVKTGGSRVGGPELCV